MLQTGGSTQFSIEDEGSASEASSRRVSGPSRSGLTISGSAHLIINLKHIFGVESWRFERWRGGSLKMRKGCVTCRPLCSLSSVPSLVPRFGSEHQHLNQFLGRWYRNKDNTSVKFSAPVPLYLLVWHSLASLQRPFQSISSNSRIQQVDRIAYPRLLGTSMTKIPSFPRRACTAPKLTSGCGNAKCHSK